MADKSKRIEELVAALALEVNMEVKVLEAKVHRFCTCAREQQQRIRELEAEVKRLKAGGQRYPLAWT